MKTKGKPQAVKPSPLPRIEISSRDYDRGDVRVSTFPEAVLIAKVKRAPGDSWAYARAITRAVNAYAGLVAALTALVNVTEERGMDRAVISQLVTEARAALRAAAAGEAAKDEDP